MLKSLKVTGIISAFIEKPIYEAYQEELNELSLRWSSSFNFWVPVDPKENWPTRFLVLEIPNYLEKGLAENKIPKPFNQRLYDNIVFDYRGAYIEDSYTYLHLPPSDPADQESMKTIAIGGSVPCAIAQVYEYLCRPSETREKILERIGKVLVSNGYRTQNKGTLWVALDKVLELEFWIKTKIQSCFFELLDSISPTTPVIAFVPAAWLHYEPTLPTNEAIVIWAIDKTKALITTTSDDVVRVDLVELLYSIKRAWACQLIIK